MSKRSIPYEVPESHRRRNVPQLAVYGSSRRRWPHRVVLTVLVAVAITLAVSMIPGLSFPHLGATAQAVPQVGGLTATGVQQGTAFAVDNPISLTWASHPRADRYRVQVVLASSATSDLFRRPRITAQTSHTSYALSLDSPGTYYWRVQGETGGSWGAYTRPHRFTVVLPTIGRPLPLTTRHRVHIGPSVRLCWWPVRGVSGYYVWIDGHRPIAVAHTCRTVQLAAGSYSWRIAAFVRGKHIYTGLYSAPAHFVVVAPPQPQHVQPAPPPAPAVQKPRVVPAPPVSARPVPAPQPVQSARPVPVQPAPVQPAAPAPAPRLVAPAPAPRPVAPRPAPQQQSPGPGGCIPLYTC